MLVRQLFDIVDKNEFAKTVVVSKEDNKEIVCEKIEISIDNKIFLVFGWRYSLSVVFLSNYTHVLIESIIFDRDVFVNLSNEELKHVNEFLLNQRKISVVRHLLRDNKFSSLRVAYKAKSCFHVVNISQFLDDKYHVYFSRICKEGVEHSKEEEFDAEFIREIAMSSHSKKEFIEFFENYFNV